MSVNEKERPVRNSVTKGGLPSPDAENKSSRIKRNGSGDGVGGNFSEQTNIAGSDIRIAQASVGVSNKASVSNDGVDERILKRVQSIDDGVYLNAQGFAGDKILESTPGYIQAATEKIYKNEHGVCIVLGRDRNSSLNSGYGGKGHTQAGAMDLVVGRLGHEAKQVNEQNENLFVDPSFEKDAARVYISQKSNIDEYFNLTEGTVGQARAKSAIALKADGIRIIAREGIKLITRTDHKNSQGGDIRSVLGIDLIAGNNDDDLQPIPKGENLAEAIQKLTDHVDALNGIVDTFLMSQMDMNEKLVHHFHNSPFFGEPTTPAFSVVNQGIKTLIDQLTKTKNSLVNHKTNLVMYKQTYLKKSGKKYINSDYNNTN